MRPYTEAVIDSWVNHDGVVVEMIQRLAHHAQVLAVVMSADEADRLADRLTKLAETRRAEAASAAKTLRVVAPEDE